MTNNTKVCLHGLGAAFIGASASSLGTILVAPDRFNLISLSGFRNVVLSSIVGGVVNAAAYLKASPLPPLKITEESTSSLTVDGGAVTSSHTSVTTTESTAK